MVLAPRASLQRLPVNALRALGLPAHASLQDARRAHQAAVQQIQVDLLISRTAGLGLQLERGDHVDKLLAANAAWNTIEEAVSEEVHSASARSKRSSAAAWDESTQMIHAKAMSGDVAGVIDAIASGADPNAPTPAHGAPPIFYAIFGTIAAKPTMGYGDLGRCNVVEVLSSMPAVDLSIVGRAQWAQGRNVFDLAAHGRCPKEALAALERGFDRRFAEIVYGQGSGESEQQSQYKAKAKARA